MDQDFEDTDSAGRWHNLYIEIRNQSHECSYRVAKYPENRNLNRYRDVSPYDHSRVKLKNSENDYINASLIVMEEAQRSYILTQGPLRSTCGHFWLMIWEQGTKAVIMLNRIIEKGSEKCAQYWPTAEEREMSFKDTHFVVTLLSEDVKSCYTTRVLEVRNTDTGDTREIYHFHYTTWPDFGVPDSPASFLNFLFKVRESGSLGAEHGPSVVHCSAGIGRSGTFCLVDTCLILMEERRDPSAVDIQKVLLEMRKYRMGLIQTPDQLRFSYMAVMEGAKCIMGDGSTEGGERKKWQELSREDVELRPGSSQRLSQAPPSSTLCHGSALNGSQEHHLGPRGESAPAEEGPTMTDGPGQRDGGGAGSLRKRHREERRAVTVQRVQQIKQRLGDSERRRERWLYWKPVVLKAGAGAILALGLYVCWRYFSP